LPGLAGPPGHGALGVPDPAAAQGSPEEIKRAFRDAFFRLNRRIGLFLSLPLASWDQLRCVSC
jgi:arsenate reductase